MQGAPPNHYPSLCPLRRVLRPHRTRDKASRRPLSRVSLTNGRSRPRRPSRQSHAAPGAFVCLLRIPPGSLQPGSGYSIRHTVLSVGTDCPPFYSPDSAGRCHPGSAPARQQPVATPTNSKTQGPRKERSPYTPISSVPPELYFDATLSAQAYPSTLLS